ncbi:hypothetical protein RRG08_014606 [Elysia crispata]|uniref:Uncharacterized protein n=1 Tax=Elysia crispata TaxID=231223 RepID=A0AAE1D386_9GAST|nr:hypothetical protein RRG08_014606 [Elysia crispata]
MTFLDYFSEEVDNIHPHRIVCDSRERPPQGLLTDRLNLHCEGVHLESFDFVDFGKFSEKTGDFIFQTVFLLFEDTSKPLLFTIILI